MTFVLVHGGGCDSRCWSRLVSHLDGPVITVDLPGRGSRPAYLEDLTVSDFVDAVVDELEVHDVHDVVLVGHSLAGITLPSVAVAVPDRVAHLIFVSCAIPAPGTSVVESLGGFSPAAAEIADQIGGDLITASGALHPDLATAMFCNDMDAEQVAFTLDLLVPESFNALSQPLTSTGLPTRVPSTYIRLLQDASLSLETQTEMLARLGEPDVIDLDAGHLAMITQPVALAAVLNDISRP